MSLAQVAFSDHIDFIGKKLLFFIGKSRQTALPLYLQKEGKLRIMNALWIILFLV